MKLALVGAAAVLLCHQGELMSQCLPLGRCTLAYWRQTPWHTGGHLLEETSLDLSHNSDTWENREKAGESKRCREAERERSKNEGIMAEEGRTGLEWEMTLHGRLESFVDLGLIGQEVPLQSLLKQRQMLFQPSDLLPLDPGYFSVPVHVPNNTKTTVEALVLKKHLIHCRDKYCRFYNIGQCKYFYYLSM